MFIQTVNSNLIPLSISVFVNLIDEDQKEKYSLFRFKLKELGYWIQVGIDENDLLHSEKVAFEALQENKVYTVCAEYMLDNKWYPIQEIKLVPVKNKELQTKFRSRASPFNLIFSENSIVDDLEVKMPTLHINFKGDDNG